MKQILQHKWIVGFVIAIIIVVLLVLIFGLVYNVRLTNSVVCTVTKVDSQNIVLNGDTTIDTYKSSYHLSDSEAQDLADHPGDYRYVYVSLDAMNNYNDTFVFRNVYNASAVGKAFLLTYDTSTIFIYPGDNPEIDLSFLIKTDGKTDEEINQMLSKERITIKGTMFIFTQKWNAPLTPVESNTLS